MYFSESVYPAYRLYPAEFPKKDRSELPDTMLRASAYSLPKNYNDAAGNNSALPVGPPVRAGESANTDSLLRHAEDRKWHGYCIIERSVFQLRLRLPGRARRRRARADSERARQNTRARSTMRICRAHLARNRRPRENQLRELFLSRWCTFFALVTRFPRYPFVGLHMLPRWIT